MNNKTLLLLILLLIFVSVVMGILISRAHSTDEFFAEPEVLESTL